MLNSIGAWARCLHASHPTPFPTTHPCCRSDPGAGAGEGSDDRYQLWSGALLPDELDSKMNLGPAEPGRGSAPPTAPPSVAASSPPAGAAGAAGGQPATDIASLWGNAQVGVVCVWGAAGWELRDCALKTTISWGCWLL